MGCNKNMMPCSVNPLGLQLCTLAPQQKHHVSFLSVQGTYCCICELLPSLLGMGVRLVCPHSQADIEQQDPLLGPLQAMRCILGHEILMLIDIYTHLTECAPFVLWQTIQSVAR